MTRELAVIITLVIYKLVLVGIGLLSSGRTRTAEDFYLGGRRLGPWVAALSASASSSSAWTLLGVSGAAWAWGLGAIWIFPACVGGFVFNWLVLAPALQRHGNETGALTVTEILAGPSGQPLRRAIAAVCSLIIVVSFTAYVAAQFQGAGKTFHQTFGLGMSTSILIGAAVVVFYTMLGGFWAVSLSDTLQGLTMALAAVLVPVASLLAVGGPWELLEGMRAVDVDGYMSLTRGMATPAAAGFVAGLLGIGLGYPGQPHVVNRFMALRAEPGTLNTARAVAIGWAVLVFTGMLVVGWCGRVLYPGLEDKEAVFITAANELFHPVMSGILLAAVLSAIMSTADSQLLVAASSVTYDLGRGDDQQESRLRKSRGVVVLLSAAAVSLALYGDKEIFSRVLFAWTAVGNAFGPLLLARVLGRSVPQRAALAAIVTGFVLSVAAYSFPPTKGWAERIVPFALGLVIVWLSSRRPRPSPAESP